jgi:hypothetical protein
MTKRDDYSAAAIQALGGGQPVRYVAEPQIDWEAVRQHQRDKEQAAYERARQEDIAALNNGEAFMAWLAAGEPQRFYCNVNERTAGILAEFLAAWHAGWRPA